MIFLAQNQTRGRREYRDNYFLPPGASKPHISKKNGLPGNYWSEKRSVPSIAQISFPENARLSMKLVDLSFQGSATNEEER